MPSCDRLRLEAGHQAGDVLPLPLELEDSALHGLELRPKALLLHAHQHLEAGDLAVHAPERVAIAGEPGREGLAREGGGEALDLAREAVARAGRAVAVIVAEDGVDRVRVVGEGGLEGGAVEREGAVPGPS